jgi:hypothetical protein
VTVHATVAHQPVGAERPFVEVFDAPLAYLQVAEHLVVGFYQPVSEIRVYLVFHHCPVEILVLLPFAARLRHHGHGDILACRFRHEVFPVVDIKTHFVAAAACLQRLVAASGCDFHSVGICAQEKVERCNVLRDGHVGIIGINRCALMGRCYVTVVLTGCQDEYRCNDDE